MATRPPEPGEPDEVVHDFPDDPSDEPMMQEEKTGDGDKDPN